MRAACALFLAGSSACAQSSTPAAFVSNNGNLRGSVSSFRVHADGSLEFVQELVLANITSGQSDPGTNAYTLSLTPDGRFLAVSHTTSAAVSERVTLIRVNPDASLTHFANALTPDSPLDLAWLSDSALAVTRTRTSGTNEVIVYRFDEAARTLTEIDREAAGSFCSKLTLSPDGRMLLANDSPLSGGGQLRAFLVDPVTAMLSPAQGAFTSTTYALGAGMSPDGRFVYVAGGSATPYRIGALTADSTIGLTGEVPGNAFPSAGQSPKQCVVAPAGGFLFVGHGTDGTIRRHAIDPDTGALTEIGIAYDVGIQSSLGDIAALRIDAPDGPLDLLLFTDKETFDGTPRGLFSARLDGPSFTVVTERLDTMGVSPNDIAAWPGLPSCDPDFNRDGVADQDDVAYLVNVIAGGANPTGRDPDFDRDGVADQNDYAALVNVVAGGPCS